jgi:hypothetical protein
LGYDEIIVQLTAGPSAAGNTYIVQITNTTGAGSNFQPGPQGGSKQQSDPKGTLFVGPLPAVNVIQIGWDESINRVDLWKSTNFTSNGDSKIGTVVWQEPNVYGSNALNEPAAFNMRQGALTQVILQSPASISNVVNVQVDAVPVTTGGSPQGFTCSAVQVQFASGENGAQAIISGSNMVCDFSKNTTITSADYQFNWSIQWYAGNPYVPFQSTRHHLYFIHSIANNRGQYQTTTTRLDYATGLVNGQSVLAAIVNLLNDQLQRVKPTFSSYHIPPRLQNNVWGEMDGTVYGVDQTGLETQVPGLDCESVAAIAAAELQQLGYGSAKVGKAFPTGANGPLDTDATTQESKTVNGAIYSLAFYSQDAGYNFFEGFLYLSDPSDTPLPVAFTIFPNSNGPLYFTTCSVVSPGSDKSDDGEPQGIDNRISFRVLTSTYPQFGVSSQVWFWDYRKNTGSMPSPPYLADQIPLPRNGCQAPENY